MFGLGFWPEILVLCARKQGECLLFSLRQARQA